MEDIAQKEVDVSGTVISTSKFSFDFDKQFSEIGLRYGFVMDTKLIFDNFQPEYKDIWIKYFKIINLNQNIEEVDKIEDCLIEVIQQNIQSDDAFFINAIETGSLTQDWVDKILKLLNSNNNINNLPVTECSINNTVIYNKDNDKNNNIKSNVNQASNEKHTYTKRKYNATIKRIGPIKNSIINKKNLLKTRRNIKLK